MERWATPWMLRWVRWVIVLVRPWALPNRRLTRTEHLAPQYPPRHSSVHQKGRMGRQLDRRILGLELLLMSRQ